MFYAVRKADRSARAMPQQGRRSAAFGGTRLHPVTTPALPVNFINVFPIDQFSVCENGSILNRA
jgi:hypothetical protein